MSITHKFLQTNFGNGFETHNAILDVTPYSPEVLFIGTYNPNTHGQHNLANFFYGRDNYLFPLLHGIFNNQQPYNQAPPYTNIIWPLCTQLKLSFADLIRCVFPNQNVGLIPNSNKITHANQNFNLLKDQHLISLHEDFQAIDWNHIQIANFINQTTTIKYVYLTQRSDNIFLEKFREIQLLCNRSSVSFRTIHTPSGQNLSGVPKEFFLGLQWLIQQQNGSGFDLNWLHSHNIHQFNHGNYSLNF